MVIAALIAARTGQARGYFLLRHRGLSFVYVTVLPDRCSCAGRWSALAWEFVDPVGRQSSAAESGDPGTGAADPIADPESDPLAAHSEGESAEPDGPGPTWYRRPALLRAYQLATVAGALVFLARGVVQLALYDRNSTGWLAVARIAMGVPLYLVAVAFGV